MSLSDKIIEFRDPSKIASMKAGYYIEIKSVKKSIKKLKKQMVKITNNGEGKINFQNMINLINKIFGDKLI